MQERTLKGEAVWVMKCPSFSTSQQHIYCLIMQSHELDTTKPTNQFPRVIFLDGGGWKAGGRGNTSIWEALLKIPFCAGQSLQLQTGIMWGLFLTVSIGKGYLQSIWSFQFFFLSQMMVIQKQIRGSGLCLIPGNKGSLFPTERTVMVSCDCVYWIRLHRESYLWLHTF